MVGNSEERIKSLTGNDQITARRMHRDFVTFPRTHKLVVIANARPRIENPDPAMRRRLLVVPFDAQVAPDEVDPHLKGKLLNEAPLIMRWAVRGCLAWQERGLSIDVPARVRAATAVYFEDEDLFLQWVEECCELVSVDIEPPQASTAPRGDSWATPTEALVESYTSWLKSRGEPPASARSFARDAQRLHLKPLRIPIGDGHLRGYWGIRRRPLHLALATPLQGARDPSGRSTA